MKGICLFCFLLILAAIPAMGDPALDARAAALMKGQQVRFTENKGQVMDVNGKPVPSVLFTCAVPGLTVYITEQGLTYVFVKSQEGEEEREKEKHKPGTFEEVKMEIAWANVLLEGASIRKGNIVKDQPGSASFNYFSADLPNGIYDVKQYEKITIKDVYPGIDWVLYGSSNTGMKYDLIVHPGADPKQIKLICESEKPLKIDKEGNIHIRSRIGELTENAPVSFTDDGKQITSRFTGERIDKYRSRITYTIGSYDTSRQLIIDPQLVWGTFIGGNGHDGLYSITHDYTNNIFVAGYTISTDFPVQNNGTFYSSAIGGNSDAFIMKFDQNNNLVWSSYLGGSSGEEAYSIGCDPSGNVFITGSTGSPNFPTLNAGTFYQGALAGAGVDIFITKFDNAGMMLWSTFYGGSSSESPSSIDCDAAGNLFITGYTSSNNLPVQNAGTYFQGTLPGTTSAFVLKFDNAGNRLWATYYGGGNNTAAYSLACDNTGNVFVTGQSNSINLPTVNAGTFFQGNTNGGLDVYINKFDNNGNLLWATYYGGGSVEDAYNIECSPSGNVYITGTTLSNNFPLQNSGGFFLGTPSIFGKVYILKFDNAGNRLWATLFGGNNSDDLESFDDIAIDPCENVYISCTTWSSSGMPCLDPGNGSFFDNTYAGSGDCFLVKFDANDVLQWGTYIGGASQDFREPLELDGNNDLYIGGEWTSYTNANANTLPLLSSGAYFDGNPHGQDDSFIMKFHVINPVMPVGVQVDPTCQCTGSATVNLTASCALPPYTYEWSTGAQISNTTEISDSITGLCAGSYWVAITSAAGVDTVYYTLTQNSLNVNLTATNVNCSYSDTGSVAAVASNGTAPYTYTWSSGGTGAVEDSLSTGIYTVTVTDANGCTATASDTIAALNPLPVAGFTASDTILCEGKCASFTNSSTNALSYTWDLGDGVSTLQQPSHCYLIPGTYSVSLIAVSAGGCSDTLIMNNYIDVHPAPTAAFTADPLSSPPLSPITFTDQSTGASSWYWSFGDLAGGTSSIQDPVYTYAAADDYEVVLTVSNSYACTDTASLSIHIEDVFALYIPNAFTPDGDGLNDEWMPYGVGIDESRYEVLIFDRWGELIWQNNVWGRGWNGVPDGATKIAQEDVYVWKIAVSAMNGERRNYIGRVTLVR